jgi:glycosyltransferase involved in cell wall biosynthesis
MRLLVITARYPTPDRPAAGHFVRDRLADPDLATTIVAPDRYDRPGWLRYLSMTWRALTARGPFDGVEGHFVLPSGFVALVVARLRGLPLVVYAHGGDVRDMAQRNPVFTWLARRVVRGADAVATNSDETAALVHRLGAGAEVIPPGIDLPRFFPTPRPPERRVLYLGGNVPHKGVALARRLADTLAGPGLREVAPDEVPTLIAAHDVILVPSLAEPFGLVAAEAMASGRWVVARAVGGLRQIVTDGVNGSLGESDADLEAALSRVPDYDPQAVAATAERFSVERHRAGMTALWERVLARRRDPR